MYVFHLEALGPACEFPITLLGCDSSHVLHCDLHTAGAQGLLFFFFKQTPVETPQALSSDPGPLTRGRQEGAAPGQREERMLGGH